MSTKHTPGPWFDGRSERFPETYIRASNDQHVAVVAWNTENGDANARLIAAAPELLALLQETLKPGAYGIGSTLAERIEEAIAAATGSAQ